MGGKSRDMEKERGWQRTIRAAACSGLSVREFCRQQRVKESQFYWWQRKLREGGRQRILRRQGRSRPMGIGGQASFALVSPEAGAADAGIELVLGDGRRVRISRGVDVATLRTVLSAVGPEGC